MNLSTFFGLNQRLQKKYAFWRKQHRYHGYVIDGAGELRLLQSGESTDSALKEGDPAAAIRNLQSLVAADRRIWTDTNLTFQEQTDQRQKPIRFMRLQVALLRLIGGRVVVEVGSSRAPLRHPIAGFNPVCCNDGHSTHQWVAQRYFEVHTVDINPKSKQLLDSLGYPNLHAYTADGVGFLRDWRGPKIDLLFLDAWDVGTPAYAEQHQDAFNCARDKLSPRHIIGIDDTDFEGAGKGKFLVPYLRELGYRQVVDGRQTVFVNFPIE